MKKLIALFTAISSLALASTQQEIRLGVGYEPFRFETNTSLKEYNKLTDGFIINAEWLPYRTQNGILQAGLGVEHSFGRTTLGIADGKGVEIGSTTPIYVTAKVNLLQGKDLKRETSFDYLYLNSRLGYSVNVGKQVALDKTKGVDSTLLSGPYAALGLGSEYKYGFIEANYGVNYIPKTDNIAEGKFIHKVGITIGAKLDFNVGETFKPVKNEVAKAPIKFFEEKPIGEAPKVQPTEIVTLKEDPVITVMPEKVVEPVVEKVEEVAPTKTKVIKHETGQAIVKFDFDKAFANPTEYKTIIQTKDTLNNFKYVDVDITGHTDKVGSAAYNYKLGQKRAEYVANELNKLGINDTVVIKSVKSKGETQPVSKNNKENRRVEIDFNGWWDAEEDIK